jgi:hypothetical protein
MINKNCENNRFNLWNYLRKIQVITLPNTQEKYEDWKIRKFGKDDQTSIDFFNKILKSNDKSLIDWTVDDFFKGYVCDIKPDSDYCKAAAKPSDDSQPVKTSGSKYWDVAIAAGDALLKTSDPNQMGTKDESFYVFNTGRVITNNAKGKFMGTMEITGDKSYKIKYDDGDVYDSTTSKTTKSSQLIDVVIKPEEIVNGSKLVKIGMRGDIVTQIQNLLIKKGFKNISKSGQSDGIYGSRTKKAVIDFQIKNDLTHDGIVGKKTWDKLNSESPYVDTSDMDTPESLAARDAAVKADAEAAAQKQNNQPNKIQEEIRKIVSRKLKSLIN